MSEFRIKIEVTSATKEEAVKMFNDAVDRARETEFASTAYGGGGCGVETCSSYGIWIGNKPLSDSERIDRLEAHCRAQGLR